MPRLAEQKGRHDPTVVAERTPDTTKLDTTTAPVNGAPGKRAPENDRAVRVLALQRSVGNRATSALLTRKPLPVQREVEDVIDSVNNIGSNVTGGAGAGAGIGTGAWYDKVGQHTDSSGNPTAGANSSNLGNNIVGNVGSDIGLVSSLFSLGTSSSTHHKARKEYGEAKKMQDGGTKEALLRTRGRKRDKSGMDVTSNTLNSAGGVSSVVTSGLNVGNAIGTVGNTASNVAGVAGSVIGLPISMFSLARSSHQANKQRQRMERVSETKHAMSQLTGHKQMRMRDNTQITQAKSTSEQETEDAKHELDGAQQAHDDAQQSLETDKTELQQAEKRLSDAQSELSGAKTRQSKAEARLTRHLTDPTYIQAVEEAKAAVATLEKTIKTEQSAIKRLQKKIAKGETALSEKKDLLKTAMETHAIKSQSSETNKTGHLTHTGDEAQMPTLEEIARYVKDKNKRGFTRRGLAAGAAALGVAGGAIGIAGAVESLKGNNALSGQLGVATAVIGGVAAAIGIGVAIWKTVNWAKKRKKQAAAMKAAKANDPTKAEATGTYNPFKSNVDQTTQRRHMATALYLYATKGTTNQRTWGVRLMSDLDPKGPWNVTEDGKKRKKDSSEPHKRYEEDPGSKAEVIQHLMEKMASGG